MTKRARREVSDEESSGDDEPLSKRSRNTHNDEDDDVVDEDDVVNHEEAVGNENDETEVDDEQPEAGGISYILLENFMCHTKMEISFHENVTFVTGENGSGKSAILTAIQVCLGSKASATNRGSAIKDLVKTGSLTATITIHLRNCGRDAYKPHIYGKKIIVVRKIDAKGGSSYQIKSADGKVIARTGKELHLILDQFNVHIDNPTTVMTQDISRQFLATKKTTQKYEFFLKATQLAKMLEEFEKTRGNKDALVRALETKEEALREREVHLKKLEEEANAAKEMARIEEKRNLASDKYYWALVREAETKKKSFIEKRDQQQSVLEKFQKDAKTQQQLFHSESEKTDNLRSELDTLNVKLIQANSDCAQTQDRLTELLKKEKVTHTQIEDYKRRIQTCESAIKGKEREIHELQNKDKVDKTAENQKIERQIQKLEERIKLATDKLHETQNKLPELDSEFEKCSADYDRLLRERENEKKVQDKDEAERRNLSQQGIDKYGYFPASLSDVFYKVFAAHQSQFESIPIGPIGLLMEPKDLDWACAIEECLIKGLKNFIFNSNKDYQLFIKLCEQYRIDNTRWGAILQKHSSRKYRVDLPDQHTTIYEQLQLDNSIISKLPFQYDMETLEATLMNSLVDQHQIESIILIPEREEAMRVMFANPRPPKFVTACYLPNGTQLVKRGTSQNISTKNLQWCKLWGKNFEQRIQQLSQNITQKQTNIDQITRQGKQIGAKKKEIETQRQKQRAAIRGLQNELTKITHEKERLQSDLKAQMEEPEEDNTGQITELRIIIKNKRHEIETYKDKIDEIKKNSREFIEKKDEITAELMEKKKVIEERQQEIEQQRDKIMNHMKEIALVKKKLDQYEKLSQEARDTLVLLQSRVDEYTDKYDKAYQFAKESAAEEVDPGDKSAQQLAQELNRLDALLAEKQKQFGGRTVDDIDKAYFDALAMFNDKKNALDICKRGLDLIREGLTERFEKWKKIREDFGRMTSHYFNVYMSQKGHSGKLVFKHDEKSLDLEINLQKQSSSGAVTDAKSLSGGERSFSTVCFVLALWEVVESPVRALDEFDIFMDAVYRKKAIDMILEKATTVHKKRQLILISPHDTTMIGAIDRQKMKVFKMQAPERQQNQASLERFMRAHQA